VPLGKRYSLSLDNVIKVLLNLLNYLLNIFPLRYIMEKVDFVLVGAEGVVESGGIINKVQNIT
jgi:hypothetical protein